MLNSIKSSPKTCWERKPPCCTNWC